MQTTLYLMVGYPGSGKTTASRIIQKLTGAVHLWADHERNTMFPNPTHDHQENLQLYAALNQKTAQLLRDGHSVIFDTNFNFYKDRKRLRVTAAKIGARTVLVWVTTPKDTARQRATGGGEHSDTRIWGSNMPVDRFDRMASNLQEPTEGEHPIKLQGIDLDEATVARALQLPQP